MARTADLLIVGGGVVGLTAALEAKRRWPQSSIALVEKEATCGLHASSRNSGVLHAGFYYATDSLKARFTVEGNRLLTKYCESRGLVVNRCGKLVVSRSPEENAVLEELTARGKRNGCRVELVDEQEARELEPRIKTVERALFSPTTSSIDPVEVMRALVRDAAAAGIHISTESTFLDQRHNRIRTNTDVWSVGHVINAAGLYADQIAKHFGFGSRYAIIPFKGVYLLAKPGSESLRRHVYPVPSMTNQFHLGLHFTVSANGLTKIGPTAIPALWREQYSGFHNFRAGEALDVMRRQASLFIHNSFGFRGIAVGEIQKYSRRWLVKKASALVRDVNPANFVRWGRPGIRAQLFDVRDQSLVLDFKIEGDERSTHVLNAVSPAFTCCFPFAAYLIDRVEAVSKN